MPPAARPCRCSPGTGGSTNCCCPRIDRVPDHHEIAGRTHGDRGVVIARRTHGERGTGVNITCGAVRFGYDVGVRRDWRSATTGRGNLLHRIRPSDHGEAHVRVVGFAEEVDLVDIVIGVDALRGRVPGRARQLREFCRRQESNGDRALVHRRVTRLRPVQPELGCRYCLYLVMDRLEGVAPALTPPLFAKYAGVMGTST